MNKKLLIIIPYRDREDHLKQTIPHIQSILSQQNIPHSLLIVEQNTGHLFNRGLMCNIGFIYYAQNHDYVCFHDVDMICNPIDYSYSKEPICLISNRTKKNDMYSTYFGGITLMDKTTFKKINGFSNQYWGWGAEDDDLFLRCKKKNINICERRKGFCVDLETVDSSINRKNNPHYEQNVKQFLNRYHDISNDWINNDGLNNTLTYSRSIKNINNNFDCPHLYAEIIKSNA